MLEAWRSYQTDTEKGYTFVCRSRGNRMVNPNGSQCTCRIAGKRAGVSMPMYALRHIAASHVLAGGADLAAVAARLDTKT